MLNIVVRRVLFHLLWLIRVIALVRHRTSPRDFSNQRKGAAEVPRDRGKLLEGRRYE
jgi:hypothetical protein